MVLASCRERGAMRAPPPMRPPAATWRPRQQARERRGARVSAAAKVRCRLRRVSVANGKRCRVLFQGAQWRACLRRGGEAAAAARRVRPGARRKAHAASLAFYFCAAALAAFSIDSAFFRIATTSSTYARRFCAAGAGQRSEAAPPARAALCQREGRALALARAVLDGVPKRCVFHTMPPARARDRRVRERGARLSCNGATRALRRRRRRRRRPLRAARRRTGAVEGLLHGRKQHVRGKHGPGRRGAHG